MKKLVEFKLDGEPVYVETEISEQQGIELVRLCRNCRYSTAAIWTIG